MQKKSFFTSNTISNIKEKEYRQIYDIAELEQLKENQYTIIPSIIPPEYSSSRKFLKHAPEVMPKRYKSIDEAIESEKMPWQLRKEAFDNISGIDYSGYSFIPLGRDRRKRKVSLIECLEGARLYTYANQNTKEKINVRPYDDAKKVGSEGASIVVSLPSRTIKNPRIRLKLMNIPIIDNKNKYAIANNFSSDHSCESKMFNIRYRYSHDKESSNIFNICAHEIAAYLGTIDYYLNEEKNPVPLQMSQFAIPNQKTVDYYLKLENNVLIKDESLVSKEKLRKMNRAEKEIALWQLVKSFGNNKTFFSKKSIDKRLKDYDWGK